MIMNIMIMMFYAMGKAGLHIKEQAENNKDLEEVLFQHGFSVQMNNNFANSAKKNRFNF